MLWLVHIRVPENCLADLEYIEIRHFVGEFTTVSAEYVAYYLPPVRNFLKRAGF